MSLQEEFAIEVMEFGCKTIPLESSEMIDSQNDPSGVSEVDN